jgi:hypothetical protein
MKITNIRQLPDNSRTFIIENNDLVPLNSKTLHLLFNSFIHNKYFKARGFQGIKYITLNGFTFLSDYDNDILNIHEFSDVIDQIHGLIRIVSYNKFEDYISSIKNLSDIENKYYPRFKLRVWSDDISMINPYRYINEDGDALKLLMNRWKQNEGDENLLDDMLKKQRCLPSLIANTRNERLFNKYYYGI